MNFNIFKMKIRAFTIMEITIALLLSTILIMMCYEFFSIINREITIQKKNSDNRIQELMFRKYIETDFFNAQGIYLADSGIVCKNDSIEIKYEFQDSLILRKYILTDSFEFLTLTRECWNDSLRIYELGSIVNKVKLKLLQVDKELSVELNKTFGSDVYFK